MKIKSLTKRTQEGRRTDQHIPWVTWSYACDYRQMFMLPSNKRIQVWSHEEMWKAEWVYRAPTLHSEVQSVGSNPTFTAQGGCWPHEGRHRVRWPRGPKMKRSTTYKRGLRSAWLSHRPNWLGLRHGQLGLRPGWLGRRPGRLDLRPDWLGWLG